MKFVKMLTIAAAMMAGTLFAAEPVLSFPLNEGDFKAVKEANGKVKVNFWNQDQFSWVDGPDGKALSFNTPDGSKKFAGVWFYAPKDFDPAKGFTFSALIKTPEKMHRSRQYEVFHWDNNHSKGPGFRIYVSWKSLYLMFGAGEKPVVIASKNSVGTLKDDTWYHIAASYDGKTARIYVDGVLRGKIDGALAKSTRKWAAIGASSQSGAAYGFNGIINKVQIFDKVLSDTEIAAMKPEK